MPNCWPSFPRIPSWSHQNTHKGQGTKVAAMHVPPPHRKGGCGWWTMWVMVGENGTGSTWGLCLLAKRCDVETRQPHHLYTTPSVTTSRCYECSTFYMNTLQTREDNEETERQCEIATIIYTCHFLQKWGFEAIGVHRPLLNMVKELERAHIITGYELESCFHARTADIACVVLTITVTWH